MYNLLVQIAIQLPYKTEQQEKFLKLQAEVEDLLQYMLVLKQQQKLGIYPNVNSQESPSNNISFEHG